jgi:hypothetical protein
MEKPILAVTDLMPQVEYNTTTAKEYVSEAKCMCFLQDQGVSMWFDCNLALQTYPKMNEDGFFLLNCALFEGIFCAKLDLLSVLVQGTFCTMATRTCEILMRTAWNVFQVT